MDSNIAYRESRFATHTSLPRDKSAVTTATWTQKTAIVFALIILATGFIFYPHQTAITVIAVLSFIYFADMIFNLFVISKSLNVNPEVRFTSYEISKLKDSQLPLYTILCPLYREANVLELFMNCIDGLDWPKNKLEVLLLLEEDDSETLEAINNLTLPFYIKAVVVPHSLPKTKPKACNYGLALATGEYLVVYDAEDIPEPAQLKKAYLGFQKYPEKIKCFQAKLNFFNPRHNFLTRFFTAEYSLWFDLILPGLQSMDTYIPLGGTSNHFRTEDLRALLGWDPYNVTEDCDLGARIFNSGYRTAILDSTTYEEANSDLRNWIRQRSRWIKGYMQTYLVHMRKPVKFARQHGLQSFVFHSVVGMRVVFLIINPILWLLTLGYFALHSIVGPQIEALYPSVIFYIAVTSLVFGNFLYVYYYMLGCARRHQWRLLKYIYLMPAYWLLGSLSAVIAFYQLLVKPHYWEKTEHGLSNNVLEGFRRLSSEPGA